MIKKREATSKEKKEIALIIGSVFIVAIIGMIITNISDEKVTIATGASINPNVPTYAGTLVLLKDYCKPVTGTGTCDSICGNDICMPVEENCGASLETNSCVCCEMPN
jgi:hypothetical protein